MTQTASDNADPGAFVRAYHQRTKHRLDGFAAGPDTLDWDDQPEAFRDYGDCPRVQLPLSITAPTFTTLAAGDWPPPAPLAHAGLGAMLGNALGIASWKQYGPSRWAVRCNPSSGNLHPTEAYLVFPGNGDLAAGLYHYRPQDHQLEQRCAYPAPVHEALFTDVPEGGFLIGFASIPWREAWKYGERAWRYCLLDLGHALGALRYAAALVGWQVTTLDHLGDDTVAKLLGLDRRDNLVADEPEYPELICMVTPAGAPGVPTWSPPEELLDRLRELTWQGQANRLSPRHDYRWPLIDDAIAAAAKPPTDPTLAASDTLPSPRRFDTSLNAVDLIQRRRSAQAMDGTTGLSSDAFFTLLDHTLPRTGLLPWGPNPAPAQVHLLLFVHRIDGLAKGVYALPRRHDGLEALQTALRDEFTWTPVDGSPAHLPLHQLVGADARKAAARLACQQAIAADGAFSVAMLGEFDRAMDTGPWGYRQLMIEAGLVGQALYLGAEASGVQGTGIGCFFDDGLHELFGLQDTRYQVLYQFTVGQGLADLRISSERPYPELRHPEL